MNHSTPYWSRRRVLRGAGSAALYAAVTPALDAVSLIAQAPGDTEADRPISDVMRRLTSYMSEARTRALPAAVVERAKRHVLDALAAMVSGSELVPGRNALRFARSYGGAPIATVV